MADRTVPVAEDFGAIAARMRELGITPAAKPAHDPALPGYRQQAQQQGEAEIWRQWWEAWHAAH